MDDDSDDLLGIIVTNGERRRLVSHASDLLQDTVRKRATTVLSSEELELELDSVSAAHGLSVARLQKGDVDRAALRRDEEKLAEVARIEEDFYRSLHAVDDMETAAAFRVEEDARKRKGSRIRREETRSALFATRIEALRASFERAGRFLFSVLARRQREVADTFGAVDTLPSHSWVRSSNWKSFRRTVEFKVELIRGVRDKLPAGRYVLMFSHLERLGGSSLPWRSARLKTSCPIHDRYYSSCECCAGNLGSTVAVEHSGQTSACEMRFGQSLYTVAPSQESMKPYMTVVMELVLLAAPDSGRIHNRVVGWGAFPLSDPQFDVVKGKYKVPMLRGPVNALLDTYEKIEEHTRESLDNWIGSCYFEVIHMQRSAGKRRLEYDTDRAFTSQLLALSAVDQEIDVLNDAEPDGGTGTQDRPSRPRHPFADTADTESLVQGSMLSIDRPSADVPSAKGAVSDDRSPIKHVSSATADRGESHAMVLVHQIVPGLHYTLHTEDEAEISLSKLTAILHAQNQRAAQFRAMNQTHAQRLEKYSFAIVRDENASVHSHVSEKLRYMARALYSDLGLFEWRTIELWLTLLFCILTFVGRIYMHYLGEWLFLTAVGFPVYGFNPGVLTMDLGYNAQQQTVWYTIGVICCGVLFNLLLFLVLVLIAWSSQKLVGSFFYFGSQFIVVFGIMCFFDEVFLLIVDCILQNWSNGDAFLLYNYYAYNDNTGYMGAMLTTLIFILLMILVGSVVYQYVLRIHNNGLMHDVWVRTHGPNYAFFVPHDLEVSEAELRFICQKAEAWRGARGERRKIVVFDYITKDDADADYFERTTHLAIFTMDTEGAAEPAVYRQFLRLPDGIVLEVLPEMDSMGSQEYYVLQNTVLRPLRDQIAGLHEFLRGPVAGSMRPMQTRRRRAERFGRPDAEDELQSRRWIPAVHRLSRFTGNRRDDGAAAAAAAAAGAPEESQPLLQSA